MKFNLPIKYRGDALQIGILGFNPFLKRGSNTYIFIIKKNLIILTIGLLCLTLLFQFYRPQEVIYVENKTIHNFPDPADSERSIQEFSDKNNDDFDEININYKSSKVSYEPVKNNEEIDALGFMMEYFDSENNNTQIDNKTRDEKFLIEKQLVITKYLIDERVSRIDKLSNHSLLKLSQKISNLFIKLVLTKIKTEPHVLKYFTDSSDLYKLETALVEQIKYHIPASITLAQSALETGYGKRIMKNNYFGIKDKSKKTRLKTTTEYYNKKELKANRYKIISKKKVYKNGKTLYKCLVKDRFIEYPSPWHSFRHHSIYLNTQKRYAPLFTKGKNYKAWANAIGSEKYGGVGYATSPIYGEILKKVILRYHLHLLDF